MPLAAPILETTLADRTPDRQARSATSTTSATGCCIVATDRISAFDYILGSGIPDKGKVLTQISAFWFERTRRRSCPTTCISTDPADYPAEAPRADARASPAARCSSRKTTPLPIECVARGYLSGSGWKDYSRHGQRLRHPRCPPGLRESERLPEPIFTPATKAQSGHDINISEAEAAALVGARRARPRARADASRSTPAAPRTPSRAASSSPTRSSSSACCPTTAGRPTERVILIDEVLTPDSSRFWPRDGYAPGGPQPSFDKQFVRDYLEAHPLEQAAAGARRCPTTSSCRTRDEVPRGLPPPDRPGARLTAGAPMIATGWRSSSRRWSTRGVHFEDAVREFEKRFIARVLGAVRRQPRRRPPTPWACTATP